MTEININFNCEKADKELINKIKIEDKIKFLKKQKIIRLYVII
jgi:hypothetical protein